MATAEDCRQWLRGCDVLRYIVPDKGRSNWKSSVVDDW